jgi:hypothetical protein
MQKELPCEPSLYCLVVTVLKVESVNITTTDANGYKQSDSGPVQRLSVSIDGRTADSHTYNGVAVSIGDLRTMDIICWQHCFDLNAGSKHIMGSGREFTHYGGPGVIGGAQPVPYVSIGHAWWQILEICSHNAGDRCIEDSTLNDR